MQLIYRSLNDEEEICLSQGKARIMQLLTGEDYTSGFQIAEWLRFK